MSTLNSDLDQIAYILYLQTWVYTDDELVDMSDSRLKRLGEKWRKEWLPFRDSKHDGDCTNMPYSCIRCVMDDLYKNANRILKSNPI
jgi:hypothetical protein